MADTLGRIIRTVAAGTASMSNRFQSLEALDAVTAHVLVTSNLNHYGDESTYRTLASVPGFGAIERTSPTGASPAASPADFDWFGRFNASPAPSVQCLGTHVIHRVARASTTWPKLVLRGRVIPSTTVDACLVAIPGRDGVAAAVSDAALYAVARYSVGAWQDIKIELPLVDQSVAPINDRPLLGAPSTDTPAASEIVTAMVCTVWVAFFTGGGKGETSGLTLALEPP